MAIRCLCSASAIIAKSIDAADETQLHCYCADCNQAFVAILSFKHFVSKKIISASVKLQGQKAYCCCGCKATAYKTLTQTNRVTDVYYKCSECDIKFVIVKAYSHALVNKPQAA